MLDLLNSRFKCVGSFERLSMPPGGAELIRADDQLLRVFVEHDRLLNMVTVEADEISTVVCFLPFGKSLTDKFLCRSALPLIYFIDHLGGWVINICSQRSLSDVHALLVDVVDE